MIAPDEATNDLDQSLTEAELAHYSRHLLLPEIGVIGQKKLKSSSVLMIGAGGLGAPLAQYLTAAGVGTLGIVEYDVVEKSNLHRQILYSSDQVGRTKLECAEERLKALNPHIKINPHPVKLCAENALDIIRDYDLVVDGTDNFPTRYLINDACVLLGKPNVYASIYRFEGQLSIFSSEFGPCYRCLYPEPPPQGMVPSCSEAGVLGVLPGIMGTLQANEVVKLILGIGVPAIGRLITFDALALKFNEFELRKNPSCVICSESATQKELVDYASFCGIEPPEPDNVVLDPVEEITVNELHLAMTSEAGATLIDVRSKHDYENHHIDGAVHISLDDLSRQAATIDPMSMVICQCQMGKRSLTAARELKKLGFERVFSLQGGILAWDNAISEVVS